MDSMETYLKRSSQRHKHLCPRQVLGVRMGIMASDYLEIELPQSEKRLLTIIETDGCFADAIEVVTGCTVGHRTLRVQDYGKVGAVFIDTELETAFRIAPLPDVRITVDQYGEGRSRWHRQLAGYQSMPVNKLFLFEWVQLTDSLRSIISRPGVRVNCENCQEEIINEREITINGQTLCRSCAGFSYYQPVRAQLQMEVSTNSK